ncbi:hypothetical protein E4U45_001361 [Claviceps purpurea]|nr:hypothetical protein E4U45_001361 [Claviceps purpurea]
MTPESSVDSNTADHGNNVAPTSSYYNDLSWNNIGGAYGPTADGVGLLSLVDKKLVWLRRICHTTAPSAKPFSIACDTRGALDHLKDKHRLSAQGKVPQKCSISENAIDRYYPNFNPLEFRGLLLDWIIQDDAAFRCLENPQLRDLLYNLQPTLEKRSYLPNGNTVNSYIRTGYFNSVSIVQDMINQSISKIHLSFDIGVLDVSAADCVLWYSCPFLPSGYQNILLASPTVRSPYRCCGRGRNGHEYQRTQSAAETSKTPMSNER